MRRVLHIFNEYLPKSEVWAYHLISATTSVEHHIFAKYYNDNVLMYGKNKRLHYLEENKLRLSYDATSKRDAIKKARLWKQARHIESIQNQILELLKSEKFSILHFHFGTTAADQIDIVENTASKKIVSFYGWDYIKAPQSDPKYKDLYKRVFSAADLFLVEGPAGADRLCQLGCNEDQILHLPLGVHTNTSKILGKKKCKDSLKLVQIASFSEKKGQKYTIEALHQCVHTGMDIHLTLVGDDRDPTHKKEVVNLITKLGLNDHVTTMSWIDFNQIGTFLAQFDAFIHPSCHAVDGDCEGGAPVIILQAQSYGLPIITTDHCDIPSQVKNGVTGLISPEKNVVKLSELIQKLYNMNDVDYTAMSNRAIEWVNENFDYEVLGNRLSDIYTNLHL